MEFTLKRKLKMKKYIVVAETARFKEREDIISVLKLANEKGGTVNPTQICNELLGGKPIRVGERIILRCSELELLSREGELIQRGIVALQENKIPEPERAIYTIWYAEDSLVLDNERIITIEQSRISSGDELFAKDAEENKKLIDLPSILTENPDKFDNLILRGERAKILSIEKKGKKIKIPDREQMYVEWQISQFEPSKLLLDGFLQKKLNPPAVSFDDVFRAILGSDINNWNDALSSYRVNFDSLSEKESNTFQMNKEFTKPIVGEYGEFNPLKIILTIIPASQEDADNWAKWLQITNLSNYMSRDKFQKYQERISLKFIEHKVNLLSQEQLISLLQKEKTKNPDLNKNFWFLQTPLDLVIEGD